MKRLFIITLLAAAVFLGWASGSRAQGIPTAPPTPTPDPQVYTDPGMFYRAPAEYRPVAQRQLTLDQLGENPTVLAAWIDPIKDAPRRLLLSAESSEGTDVGGWETQFEQQMRGQFDSTFFKNKQHISLRNGMPAMYEEMTEGEGFQTQKFYVVLWADGARGMTLMLVTGIGDIGTDQARSILTSGLTAVRYPVDRG